MGWRELIITSILIYSRDVFFLDGVVKGENLVSNFVLVFFLDMVRKIERSWCCTPQFQTTAR